MPDLPASVYVPVAMALVGAMGVIITIAGRLLYVLWNSYLACSAATNTLGTTTAVALNKAAEAQAASNKALAEVPGLIREVTRAANQLALANREARPRPEPPGFSR